MRKAANIYWLGVKELRSFLHDYVLLALVVGAIVYVVYVPLSTLSTSIR